MSNSCNRNAAALRRLTLEEIVKTVLWVLCAILVLWTGMLGSECRASELQLKLAVDRQYLLVDEPLLVRVTVTNRGKTEAGFQPAYLEPSTSGVVFRITGPGESNYDWDPGIRDDYSPDPKRDVHLSPGESYSTKVDLTFNPGASDGKFLFHEPGVYKIAARGSSFLASEPITLYVNEPRDQDKLAHDALIEPVDKHRRTVVTYSEDIAHLEKLLRLYPNSVYARRARQQLALTCFQQSGGGSYNTEMTESKKGMRRAAELYSGLSLEKGLLAADAAIQSGLAYLAIHNLDDACEMLEAALFSPDATTTDNLRALEQMQIMDSKVGALSPVRVPAQELARVFGLKYQWDPQTSKAHITSDRVKATISVGADDVFDLNGAKFAGVYSWDGNWKDGNLMLSPRAAAAIIAKHYQSAFLDHIIQAAKTDKR